MSTLLCCSAAFSVLYNGSSIVQTPQTCGSLCGIDCFYSGLNPSGACLGCSDDLRKCSSDDNSTFAILRSTVVNKTTVPRNGCGRNRKCLLCNNTRITEPFPADSKIYFSSSCNSVVNPESPETIHVYYTLPNAIVNSEVYMQSNLNTVLHVDTLPLQFSGKTTFKSDSPASLTVKTPENNCTGLTAVRVSPFPSTGKRVTFTASSLELTVPSTCECGISVSSLQAANEKSTKVSFSIAEVSVDGVLNTSLSTFFPVAAANVGGSITINQLENATSDKVISLASQFATLSISVGQSPIPKANLVDLSKMMSVFGSFYEIEFYHNGQEYKHEHSLWVPVANRYLSLTLLFFNTLAWANGVW